MIKTLLRRLSNQPSLRVGLYLTSATVLGIGYAKTRTASKADTGTSVVGRKSIERLQSALKLGVHPPETLTPGEREFNAHSIFAVPRDWNGPLFKLRNDYPLPASGDTTPNSDISNIDAPWLGIDLD
jgi:hypothetical protein